MTGTRIFLKDNDNPNEPMPLEGISGAALVTDGIQGVARNRFVSVTTNTLSTLTGSGCATFISPGVKGITIDSVRVVSGTLLLTANADYTVRYAIDAANDRSEERRVGKE